MGPSIFSYINKYLIGITLGIILLNLLILDFFLLFPKVSQTVLPGNVSLPNATQISCPQSCIDKLNLSLMSLKESSKSSTAKATSSASILPTPTAAAPVSAKVNSVKEFFIPLGIGTGNSDDWKVVDGIGAKIDPSDYGNIKTVTFEVTARIPNGNQIIWIRLYNANTYQSVAGSELTLSGGASTLLISSPISLASGNNLYQIQMKTQLKSTTNIDMSRIRIKTN